MDRRQFDEALEVIAHGSLKDAETGKWHVALTTVLDASRTDSASRQRLAEPECLTSLLEFSKHSGNSRESWSDTGLVYRCIGNACANNDEARMEVTKHGFTSFLTCFDALQSQYGNVDSKVCLIVAKMLYNICCDCEEAQKQCYKDGMHLRLLAFLGHDVKEATSDWTDSTVIDLLLWITGHKAEIEPTLQDPLDEQTLLALSNVLDQSTSRGKEEDTCSLIEIALTFFRDSTVQKQIVEGGKWALPEYLALFEIVAIGSLDKLIMAEASQDDIKLVQGLVTSLMWCLSDIAALPEYAKSYPLNHDLNRQTIERIKMICQSKSDVERPSVSRNMVLAAYSQVIANLLWSLPPSSYAHLVEQERLDQDLSRTLVKVQRETESAEVMHAISGLLVHLSRPSIRVRELMASGESCLSALEILCKHDMAPVKSDGVRLLRALAKDSKLNQQRFAELEKEVRRQMQATASDTNGEITPT